MIGLFEAAWVCDFVSFCLSHGVLSSSGTALLAMLWSAYGH